MVNPRPGVQTNEDIEAEFHKMVTCTGAWATCECYKCTERREECAADAAYDADHPYDEDEEPRDDL